MDVHSKFHIVPEECEGTKRAVMIGINYEGQEGELSGCQNDVKHVSARISEAVFDKHFLLTCFFPRVFR